MNNWQNVSGERQRMIIGNILLKTGYSTAIDALSDGNLHKTIVEHRSIMTREKGVDYRTHRPSKINFIPENEVIDLWKIDYKNMQESFIYEQ